MNAAGKTPAGGPPAGSPPKAARNPMERIVVWGGIIVLVLIALVEYRAKTGFEASLKALEDAANDITKDVSYADAQGMMMGYTSVVGPTEDQGHQTHEYKWFSLFKGDSYNIKLVASRDAQPNLVTFVTPMSEQEMSEEKARIARAEAAFAEEASREGIEPSRGGDGEGGGGAGGPGGFGGFGGGAMPNPVREALDADTDGSLSAEELSAAATALAKLDANSDGALAAEELTPPAPEGSDGPAPGRGPSRLVRTIDTNEDGNISAEELAAAGASLAKLDADGDGALSSDEMRPPRGSGGPGGPGGPVGPGGDRPRRPEIESSPAAETPAPAAEAAPAATEPATPAETAPATPSEAPAAPAEGTTPTSEPANT